MARSRQTKRPRPTRETVLETFTDHAGRPARRWRLRQIPAQRQTRAAAQGFINQPVYAFQIYLSLDLGIQDDPDDIEIEHYMDWSIEPRRSSSPTMKLIEHLMNVWEYGHVQPCWEFYTILGGNVLDFVDHSRREIMHRYTLRDAGSIDTPYVPRVAWRTSHLSSKIRHGFLIAIDNNRGWDTEAFSMKEPDRLDAPLWVRFDPRPAAQVTTIYECMRHWHEPEDLMEHEQWMLQYPNQSEIEVRRNVSRNRLDTAQGLVAGSQLRCHKDARHVWTDPAIGLEELEDRDYITSTCEDITIALAALQQTEVPHLAPAFDLAVHDNRHCTISSTPLTAEPDIRYLIYVPFLARFPDVSLEKVARRFTLAFVEELGTYSTVHFDFFTPEDASDSAILAHYRALAPSTSTIGVRTDMQSPHNEGTTPAALRRVHPMSRDPRIFCNEPGNPYTSPPCTGFVVIVDRPDFGAPRDVPAVRFLLTYDDTIDNPHWGTVNLAIWRLQSMSGVVDRLAFRTAMDHVRDQYLEA